MNFDNLQIDVENEIYVFLGVATKNPEFMIDCSAGKLAHELLLLPGGIAANGLLFLSALIAWFLTPVQVSRRCPQWQDDQPGPAGDW